MSILDSLLSGALDDDGARLLYNTVADVSRRRNFPPPEGFRIWNRDAVITVAHEFLTSTRALERLVQIAAQATDDASFARLLDVAVLNFLRDQARQTAVGAQIRRLKDVVGTMADVAVDGERIMFVHSTAEPFTGDEADLVRAARSVEAGTRRWRPDAKREGPLATRAEMTQLVQAVLGAAVGSITFAVLGRVVARRFDLDPLPATVDVDALDPVTTGPYDEIDVGDQVESILGQITEREKLVLPYLDMSTREVEQLIPLGRTMIAKTQVRLKALLAELLPPGKAGATVLRVLTERVGERDSAVDT